MSMRMYVDEQNACIRLFYLSYLKVNCKSHGTPSLNTSIFWGELPLANEGF